ncbi:MAG: hypothetical protein R3A78_14395 [Polyangiales bacterium]
MATKVRLTVIMLLTVAACGPSLRLRRESEIYFERCLAVDRSPKASPSFRRACWHAWLENYAVVSSHEDVLYADRRVTNHLPPAPDPARSQAQTAATPTALPTGENNVAESVDPEEALTPEDPAGAATETPPESPAPRQTPPAPPIARPKPPNACVDTCDTRYDACVDRCPSFTAACTAACKSERRVCSGACP